MTNKHRIKLVMKEFHENKEREIFFQDPPAVPERALIPAGKPAQYSVESLQMMAEAVQARAQVIIDAALEASSKKDIVDDKALGKMTCDLMTYVEN